jgi:hypothetical protein
MFMFIIFYLATTYEYIIEIMFWVVPLVSELC